MSHLTLCLPSIYFSLLFIDRLVMSLLIDWFFFFLFVLLQNGGTNSDISGPENRVEVQEIMV